MGVEIAGAHVSVSRHRRPTVASKPRIVQPDRR